MKLKLLFFFMLLGSFSVFAQESLLDGVWKLNSVSILKNSDNSIVEPEQVKQISYFGLFDALIFQGNDISVVLGNDYPIKGSVQISTDKISFTFMPAPIEATYQIIDDELFLERRISYPGERHPDNTIYVISTKYKKQ